MTDPFPKPDEYTQFAAQCYERAKQAREGLVSLSPQYRKPDEFNAEGPFLQDIRHYMWLRRLALGVKSRISVVEPQTLLTSDNLSPTLFPE